MYSDNALVTSAPTGSGKTVIFELAIVRLLLQLGEAIVSAKIVYGNSTVANVCSFFISGVFV